MLADGIYRVEFETLNGSGTGIVVVQDDKIRGGDDFFAYFGFLRRTDNGFISEIATRRHAAGEASVFNIDEVHIQMTGIMDGANAICTGTAQEVPGLIFKALLTFIGN